MVHAIFYMHQASDSCTGVCACIQRHQMEKTAYHFHLPIGPFHFAKFKFLQQIQRYEDAPFLGPKWPICPNENFSGNPVNKSCSFHLCLCTCQKSMSDINLLMKYWQLKNTEISLAKRSHFWLQLEDQIFPKHAVFQKC